MPLLDIIEENRAAKKLRTRRESSRVIDQFVGARLRERRLMLGLTQRDLANRVGRVVSQGMIFKYEVGKATVSAGRLYELAGALSTSVDYFFDGFGAVVEVGQMSNLLSKLMRSLSEIKNEKHVEVIGHLVRVLASPSVADELPKPPGRKRKRKALG